MNLKMNWRPDLVTLCLVCGIGGLAFAEPALDGATNAIPAAAVASETAVSTNAARVALDATNAVGTTGVATNQPAAETVPVVPALTTAEVEPRWFSRIEPDPEEGDGWWLNRFEIGTRVTSFELTDAKRPMDNRFLGSINVLKEDEDLSPTKLYANAWVLKWLGVGISYEKMGIKTWTEKPDVEPYTDGTFDVDGPILSLLACWPNSTRFTPFAEVGQWLMSGSFSADPEWANAHGIDGYQDFEVVKEEGGMVWGVGCAVQITRHVEMDVLYRQIEGALIVDHVLLGGVQHAGKKFPLDSNWMGAGIKYRF
jgi:hypothetical protein